MLLGAGGITGLLVPVLEAISRGQVASLPAPGRRSLKGAHAHGYAELDGKTIDITRVDPSFASPAAAAALVSTVGDLARSLEARFRAGCSATARR